MKLFGDPLGRVPSGVHHFFIISSSHCPSQVGSKSPMSRTRCRITSRGYCVYISVSFINLARNPILPSTFPYSISYHKPFI